MALQLKTRSTGLPIDLQKLLFACFLLVSIVPVSFLGFWVQRNALQAELQAVEEQHLLLAKNLSAALSRYAQDLEAVFKDRSELPPAVLSVQSRELLQTLNISVFVFVRGDKLIFSLGDEELFPLVMLDALAAEVAQARKNPQVVVFSPVVLDAQQQPTMYLLRENSAGELVIAALTPEYFSQVQEAVKFGTRGHAAIVDHTGQAIAHPNENWQQTAKDMSQLAAVEAMMNRQIGVTQFYSPAMEADMIAGHAFVPLTGWGVMIPQPMAELEQEARASRNIALLVSLVGLLVSAGISWKLAHMLMAPLQRLMTASQWLSQGEAVEALKLEGYILPKELVALFQVFNQMAVEVFESRLSLQEKVAEQTQELREEIEERRRLESQLREIANHDDLTGLPNRRCLVKELGEVLERASDSHASTLLLFLDLDGFKAVNDTFGHQTGDELLIGVAQRIQALLRAGDRAYRLGGDEFVLVLPCQVEANAVALSDLLIMSIRQPFRSNSQAIQIGCSIGIREIFPDVQGVTVEQILSDADAAMYEAKLQQNCAVVFEPVSML